MSLELHFTSDYHFQVANAPNWTQLDIAFDMFATKYQTEHPRFTVTEKAVTYLMTLSDEERQHSQMWSQIQQDFMPVQEFVKDYGWAMLTLQISLESFHA